MASLGCIEMNPWHSRIQSPENPDWCVIDLDPDDNPFDQVVEAAQVVKEVLDSLDCGAIVKHPALQACIFIFRLVQNIRMNNRNFLRN